MNRRARYEYKSSLCLKGLVGNPVLVFPDENLSALDMFPRMELIEDLQFRKQLPKSIGKHKF